MDNIDAELKLGWIPDYPDIRDYTPANPEIASLLEAAGVQTAGAPAPGPALPPQVDLRAWFSPVDNQAPLNSCTAHAADGLVEYYERRAFGSYTDISRRFLYKVTRELLGIQGDVGATVRGTMGTLVLTGTPPEKYWAYDAAHYDVEPSALTYALAANYKAVKYFRLDPAGIPLTMLLEQIKKYTAAGLPPMFGFTVYNSITQATTTGKIPFPFTGDKLVGGHAVVVAGYDDTVKIKHANPQASETNGALLIKNSWGTNWGDKGYGWLPYDYILKGLTGDWWSLLQATWVQTNNFGITALAADNFGIAAEAVSTALDEQHVGAQAR